MNAVLSHLYNSLLYISNNNWKVSMIKWIWYKLSHYFILDL